MNTKKGFTLAEMLGIIVLIGLLAIMIYPSINSTIVKNKEKLYKQQISNLEHIASLWGLKNSQSLSYDHPYQLTYEELKNSGYIKNEDIEDPRNGGTLPGCISVRWDASYERFIYKYDSVCTFN